MYTYIYIYETALHNVLYDEHALHYCIVAHYESSLRLLLMCVQVSIGHHNVSQASSITTECITREFMNTLNE